MKITMKLAASFFAFFMCFSSIADVKFSGYGSIVAGQTLDDGEVFTADFFEVGQYENEISFKPESIFALQATMDLGENLKGTAQLVAKGAEDFEPELDWYYLTYQINDEWSVLAGRRNIPIYYYSEYYDVGYAYPWLRPASNLYWWQIVQFNGVHFVREFELGDYSTQLTIYYGNEFSDNNSELAFYAAAGFYGPTVVGANEDWKHITGLNWNVSGEWFDIRFVYMQHKLDREFIQRDGTITNGFQTSQNFYGVGGSLEFDPFTVLFDYNYVRRNNATEDTWPTYMISIVYNIDEYQPFISYSKADQERIMTDELEEHNVISVGVRYDFLPNAALKIQYDSFEDEGSPVGGWNFHGDSKAIAVGVDFVF